MDRGLTAPILFFKFAIFTYPIMKDYKTLRERFIMFRAIKNLGWFLYGGISFILWLFALIGFYKLVEEAKEEQSEEVEE